MTTDEVKSKTSANRTEFEKLGVLSLELFGSTARGTRDDDSDYDFLVELRPASGYMTFYRVKLLLQDLLGTPKVELVLRRAVLEEFKENIFADATPCL